MRLSASELYAESSSKNKSSLDSTPWILDLHNKICGARQRSTEGGAIWQVLVLSTILAAFGDIKFESISSPTAFEVVVDGGSATCPRSLCLAARGHFLKVGGLGFVPAARSALG